MSLTTSVPCFLDIEFCQSEDCFFPFAIAWSLPDGQMKTVMIEPDDSWLPDDGDPPDVDLRYLREQGVPLIELAQVLHEDLPDQTVYVDGLDPDESLVDMIFDALSMDAPFEVAPVSELITTLSLADIEDWRRGLMFQHGLEPQLPENGVYALLMLAEHQGLVELSGQADDPSDDLTEDV